MSRRVAGTLILLAGLLWLPAAAQAQTVSFGAGDLTP